MIKIIDTETGISIDTAVEPDEYGLTPHDIAVRFFMPAWAQLMMIRRERDHNSHLGAKEKS